MLQFLHSNFYVPDLKTHICFTRNCHNKFRKKCIEVQAKIRKSNCALFSCQDYKKLNTWTCEKIAKQSRQVNSSSSVKCLISIDRQLDRWNTHSTSNGFIQKTLSTHAPFLSKPHCVSFCTDRFLKFAVPFCHINSTFD